jgi:hypothetical protein
LQKARNQASSINMMGKTSREMPLLFQSAAGPHGGTSPDRPAHRSAFANSPGQLPDPNMPSVASVLEPQSVRETPAASGTETTDAGSRLDPDELVEKIWQKIMRKLTIEQERRGWSPWN